MESKKLIYADDARRAILKEDPKLAYCIDKVKAVVAVEVVRCKDCKHYMTIHCTCDGCCISDDWYCADGERKDNVSSDEKR